MAKKGFFLTIFSTPVCRMSVVDGMCVQINPNDGNPPLYMFCYPLDLIGTLGDFIPGPKGPSQGTTK